MELSGTQFIPAAAFVLDCIFGDPQNLFHPVRIIGKGISLCVTVYRKANIKNHALQFITGLFITIIIIGLSFTITFFITRFFYRLNYWLGLGIEVIICYFFIAAKALKDESMKVQQSLISGGIEEARKNLSFIVGRDTQNLTVPAIVKATVETVSENLCDGIIAPLFYIFIGGAPLGMAYKAVNTLDSMIGYRNEEFEYLGKFPARLDDIINFLPARFSALLMILASVFTGKDTKSAVKIYIRDRYKHKSPNSAQTESVCAGALGICLGGDSYYNGALVSKPAIGADIHEPAPEHIIAANRLMYVSSIIAAVFLTAICVIAAFFKERANV